LLTLATDCVKGLGDAAIVSSKRKEKFIPAESTAARAGREQVSGDLALKAKTHA
jgi:hypothetical protein